MPIIGDPEKTLCFVAFFSLMTPPKAVFDQNARFPGVLEDGPLRISWKTLRFVAFPILINHMVAPMLFPRSALKTLRRKSALLRVTYFVRFANGLWWLGSDVHNPKTPKIRSKMILKALKRVRAGGFGWRFRFILSVENQWVAKAKQLEFSLLSLGRELALPLTTQICGPEA